MNLFELFIIGLAATYCMTFMLNELSGPGDIFGRFRSWLGVRFDEHSRPYGTNWRAEAILCFYCLSLWIGGAVALMLAAGWLLGHITVAVFLLLPFALSGGAIFLKKWAG